jgi:tetratricopeptide (TPR) repeat protein
LGYGLERLHPTFLQVFPPQLVYYQGREFVVDRAHNLWLDLAVSTGLWGVVAFAALCLTWGRQAWQGFTSTADPRTRILWIGLIAAVTGHLVDMQFSFEVTTTATVFWLLLASGFALRRQESGLQNRRKNVVKDESAALTVPNAMLPLVGVVFWIALSLMSLKVLQADHFLRQSSDMSRSLGDRQHYAIRAIQQQPDELEYRLALAEIEKQRQDYGSALVQLQVADMLAMDDPEIWRLQAELFTEWAVTDSQQSGRAEEIYHRMVLKAPNIARYHLAWGLTLGQMGNLEQAIQALERAVELDMTDVNAYRNLAIFYRVLSKDREADQAQRAAEYWLERTAKGVTTN